MIYTYIYIYIYTCVYIHTCERPINSHTIVYKATDAQDVEGQFEILVLWCRMSDVLRGAWLPQSNRGVFHETDIRIAATDAKELNLHG